VPDAQVDRRQLAEQILQMIVAERKLDPAQVTPEATLESLDVQSIDVVMVLMAVEDKFGVYVPVDGLVADAPNLGSFVDAIAEGILRSRA